MALTTNLVSYYKFDENTGTSVGDSAGTNTGTFNGTLGSQWTTGEINSGGNFNGGDNNVNCGTSTSWDLTTGMSISAWVNCNATQPNAYAKVLTKGNDQSYTLQISHGGDNKGRVRIWNGAGTEFSAGGTTTINDATWHHLVATFDGTNLIYYQDGSSITTTAAATSIRVSTNEVDIGGRNGLTGESAKAIIDEVGVWSRALSATEVTSLYNAGAGLQYPFTTNVTHKLTLLGV